MNRRGEFRISPPIAIAILIVAIVAIVWSVKSSGFMASTGGVPTGPPAAAMNAMNSHHTPSNH